MNGLRLFKRILTAGEPHRPPSEGGWCAMWPPDDERFEDRAAAGQALGDAVLAHLAQTGSRPLVLGLLRGGVPVGIEVAKAIGADFDVVITTKIGLPWQPDLSVGAIAEGGPPVFDHDSLACVGLHVGDLGPAVQRERLEIGKRQERYRGTRPPACAANRVVVIVDDGLATGVVARAAVRAVRAVGPAQLVYAAPVCAAECHDWLSDETDAVIDLQSPRDFHALGMYYRHFPPVTDEDLVHATALVWEAKVSV
jgi:putative phosphoribosyl transferase